MEWRILNDSILLAGHNDRPGFLQASRRCVRGRATPPDRRPLLSAGACHLDDARCGSSASFAFFRPGPAGGAGPADRRLSRFASWDVRSELTPSLFSDRSGAPSTACALLNAVPSPLDDVITDGHNRSAHGVAPGAWNGLTRRGQAHAMLGGFAAMLLGRRW